MNIPTITPNHEMLINQILATREADALNHEAECDESLADFSKLNKIQRKLEMQLLSLRSKNAHIKGYRAVIVGNRIKESINGMVL